MAHLVPLGAAAGAWIFGAYTWDLHNKANTPAVPVEKAPLHQGTYTHQKQWVNADRRGQFVDVEEDVDVNGARIFLVDFGTGSRTVCYTDPRVLY